MRKGWYSVRYSFNGTPRNDDFGDFQDDFAEYKDKAVARYRELEKEPQVSGLKLVLCAEEELDWFSEVTHEEKESEN